MKKFIDEKRVIEMYRKYGSMNRAALSVPCSPSTLKKILIKNNIDIRKPKAERFNINSVRF